MTYKLNGKSILFEINRADIIDISVGDVIAIEGFPGVEYVWTEQDGEFVENNPDDDIFLKIDRVDGKAFKGTGILLK
jgi:hypothetical protein